MAIPVVSPADLPAARATARTRPRVWVRSLAFAGLALYGVDRWGRLLASPPGWRLLGLALLATALAVLVPLVRHLAADLPARGATVLASVLALALMLAAFPVAGLRWQWVVHVRIAVSARAIGSGLGSLGDVLVPYLGHDPSIRLVIMLGAAVLLLDAAAALAFATRGSGEIGDGRRAAAALPLIALAIVPATLVRPAAPALQGLILFALLALFMWGERIARDAVAAAVAVAAAAGVAGAIVGPLVEQHRAWVDYRAWAGSASGSQLDAFDWNQSYGPLSWPQRDRVVLLVRAHRGDYWKAADLTDFNGVAWVSGEPGSQPALPPPAAVALHRWTEPVQVTVDDMQTSEVIGGSGITGRPELAGGVEPGAVTGTWTAERALGPGDAYTVRTYSPTPSPAALRRIDAPAAYPWPLLTSDLTLTIPTTPASTGGPEATVPFPPFHSPVSAVLAAALAHSPYLPAFRLAQRLAAESASPAAFVSRVRRLLDGGSFTYDQQTPAASDPLLAFLFRTRIGYCQQFSGAMALLLRMGGVPARVAAGFTSGNFNPETHTWAVSDVDAHAWDEVWFPRYGWVKFDPTPASAPARSGSTPEPALDRRSFALRHPTATAGARSRTATVRRRSSPAAAAGGPGDGPGGGGGGPWPAGGAVLAALLLAAIAWLLRRRAGGDPVHELERALARTGRPLSQETTLADLEQRFHDAPQAAAYVRALRLQRYGYATEAPTGAGRRALRAELREGLGVGGWLRALWALPPGPVSRGRSVRSGAAGGAPGPA
jgi:protein-glutamine gamma-glutamyltransferase